MRADHLTSQLALTTDAAEVESLLKKLESYSAYEAVIELYNSIWKMTYTNSTDVEFQDGSQLSIAHKIALINEQEDLIPSKLVPISAVEALDLGGFPEAVLFPELLSYTDLKSLSLWENGLTTLPDAFFDLTSLESIYVCDELIELSPMIENLRELKSIDLNWNNLVAIPHQLAKLDKLESLNLSGNRIERFSLDMAQMVSLQKIDLRFNSESLIIDPVVSQECINRGIELLH